jgi:hypothetical protein
MAFEVDPVDGVAGVGVDEPISASNGAGGGVVSMVQPIHPVIPRTPKTAITTGAPRIHGLQSVLVNPTMYPMNTKTETTKISPP